MPTILILGAEGFIGNNLVNHFLSEKFAVYGCDLFETARQDNYHYYKVSRLSPEWEEIFSGQAFDYCINAAGSGNVPYSMDHPFADFEANTLDTMRILDAIRRLNAKCRYLHLSSAAVYGNPSSLPVTEGSAIGPMSPYGWHKLMSEQICLEYSSLYGLSTAVVRPFSVYGPGLKKQLFWDIYRKTLQDKGKARAQAEIELWGTGEESRDFIYITDLVRSLQVVAERSSMKGEVYNIASGSETSIKKAASMLVAELREGIAIKFNQHVRKGDPLHWRADISALTSLGFNPSVDFGDGIRLLAAWMKKLN